MNNAQFKLQQNFNKWTITLNYNYNEITYKLTCEVQKASTFSFTGMTQIQQE